MSERSCLALVTINLIENLGILNFYCLICKQETQTVRGRAEWSVSESSKRKRRNLHGSETLGWRGLGAGRVKKGNMEGSWALVFCAADLHPPSQCSVSLKLLGEGEAPGPLCALTHDPSNKNHEEGNYIFI